MSDRVPVELEVTRQFQRKARSLAKKYRHIRADLSPIFERLRDGEVLGDRLIGVDAAVYKVRVKNSDISKGKSGGYRMIYWLQMQSKIVILDIYSKSNRNDVEVEEIRKIIADFTA